MKTAFLIFAPSDSGEAAALEDALEAIGVRAAARPLRGDRYEIECLAARMKDADVAVALLSKKAAASRGFRRDLHLALLYDRPMAIASLEADAPAAAFARDVEIVVGTPYDGRQEDLRERLEAAVYVGPPPAMGRASDGAPSGGSDLAIPDPARPDASPEPEIPSLEARLAPLVERVRRELEAAPAAAATSDPDALGFPKTPDAMLARWRLIEPGGSVGDYHAFYEDYADDPYFGPRAAETLSSLKRRRFFRGAGGVFGWALGTATAALLAGAAILACADGRCVGPAPLEDSGAARAAVAASFAGEADGLAEANEDLSLALVDARATIVGLETELAAARRDAARAATAARTAAAALEDSEAGRVAGEGGLELERARADAAERDAARLAAELERAMEELARATRLAELRIEDADARAIKAGADAVAALDALETERAAAEELRLTLASVESRLAGAEAALEAQTAIAAEAQTAAAARGAAATDGATRRASAAVAAGRGAGAVRLLERLETAFLEEDRRRRELGIREMVRGPSLKGSEIERLQSCMRQETGAPSAVDGLWGAETTAAFLNLSAEEADAVAACLLG